jgi:hypothetical protein
MPELTDTHTMETRRGRAAAICLLSLGLGASMSAEGSGQTTTKLSRLCGFVIQERKTGRHRVAEAIEYADFPVNDVTVSLFPRTSPDCCEGATPVAQVRTKKSGKFEFVKVSLGHYWVVAVVDGKTFKAPVEYIRSKDQIGDCNQFLFTIDKGGNLILKAIVAVN